MKRTILFFRAKELLVAGTILLFHGPLARAAYHDVILSDIPVAYYRLEELPGETTAVDASVSGFNGAGDGSEAIGKLLRYVTIEAPQ